MMKTTKKIFALLLAMVLVFGLSINALAEITITITQDNSDGTAGAETYTAYKIFDVTKTDAQDNWTTTDTSIASQPLDEKGFAYSIDKNSAWVSVLQDDTMDDYFTLTLSAQGDKYIVKLIDPDPSTANVNENNTEAVAKEIAAYLLAHVPNPLSSVDKSYSMTSTNGVATATVEDGYYLISSSLGTNLVLATTNIDIFTKNEYISDEKTAETASVTVGQNATYYVKVTLPASIDQQKSVTIHDLLDEHLKFNADSVKVTDPIKTSELGTTAPKDRTYNAATAYTVKTGENVSEYVDPQDPSYDPNVEVCTFEIVIPASQIAAIMDSTKTVDNNGKTTYNSTTVFFQYTAELLSTAAADNGYVNKEFSTYSQYTTEPSNPEVKTYDFDFTKVDEDNAKLDGAEFMLFAAWDATTNAPSGNPIEFLNPTDAVTYKKADTDDLAADKTTTIKVDSKTNNTSTKISGLGGADNVDGTNYYLVETKEPKGFNKLTYPIIVNVKDDGTITVSYNGQTLSSVNDVFDVVNETGLVLPSTGGIGTTIFYVVGGLLVLGAIVVLITKRRMSAER